ncbi:MAG: hypothetical protein AB8B61_09315 [Cyclobacteriaceae bacterium]
MKTKPMILFIGSFLCLSFSSYATIFYQAGARSTGLGNINTTLIDEFSVFNNPAALSQLTATRVGFFSNRTYALSELSTYGLALAIPKSHGTFGIAVSRFGFSSFNQTLIGLAYGKRLSKTISIGFKINRVSTKIINYNQTSNWLIDLGLFTQLTDGLSWGVHIFNPMKPQLGELEEMKTAAIFKTGISYQIIQSTRLFAELEKGSELTPITKAGLEYANQDNFFIRIGTTISPTQFFIGAGIKKEHIQLDFATAYHHTLGYTPSVSASYEF